MADSIREQVVQAFDTLLQTITTPTYETDAGSNVYGWRDTPLEQSQLPALVWRDTADVTPETAAVDLHTLTVEVDCVVVKTTTVSAMAQMRKLIADVVKVLGTDLTLGGLAHDIFEVAEEVQVEHDGKKILTATKTFEIHYTTNHFDPYN